MTQFGTLINNMKQSFLILGRPTLRKTISFLASMLHSHEAC